MAFNLLSLSSLCSLPHLPLRSGPPRALTNSQTVSHIRHAMETEPLESTIIRRNADYHPSILDYDFVQSLKSDYMNDTCIRRIEQLAEEVRCLLREAIEPFAQLELIGVLQHLGLGYLFESEIREVLEAISNCKNDIEIEKDLTATALRFRMLRQYGYEVSQDVFNSFLDDKGSFKACLSEDIKGMLSLYEASHLGFTEEAVLDEAKAFTTRHLKQIKGTVDSHIAKQVQHALELPMQYMIPRLHTRWYIEEVYEKEKNMKPLLLELATLDYNRLQALYQCNIRDMSSWMNPCEELSLHLSRPNGEVPAVRFNSPGSVARVFKRIDLSSLSFSFLKIETLASNRSLPSIPNLSFVKKP